MPLRAIRPTTVGYVIVLTMRPFLKKNNLEINKQRFFYCAARRTFVIKIFTSVSLLTAIKTASINLVLVFNSREAIAAFNGDIVLFTIQRI